MKRRLAPALILAVLALAAVLIFAALGDMLPGVDPEPDFSGTPGGTKPVSSQGEMDVYFIDCGQGDCSLLVFPDGKSLLIDGGPGVSSDLVLAAIKKTGVKSIDYMVATHPHEDHIGGLSAILDKYGAGEVFMPDAISQSATFERLLDKIEEKDISITVPETGDYIIGSAESELSVLVLASGGFSDLNNSSIVLRVKYGDISIIFTGDAEKKSEDKQLDSGLELEADIIKAGHHGSSTSSSSDYLNAVKPKYAVISCGNDNTYGHPHREVLSRFSRAKIEVFRTDTQGTIFAKTDGKTLEIAPKK